MISAELGAKLNRQAALASIAVASLLLVLKVWAVLSTGSAAMLGSLADTGLDLIASLVTLFGVWFAAQPDDHNHRFGHGKAEALTAMFQVVLILLSAFGLALQAISQLLGGERPQGAGDGVAVSVIAIAATLVLLIYQRSVIRRTGSLAITTDNVHYKSDVMLNLAVIAALAMDHWAGIAGADAALAFAIAIWLGWGAWAASQAAIEQLMDQEWAIEKRERFLEVVAQHPELRGLHDLRTRTSGNRDFVQFHVWVDGRMTVNEAHRVMDEIEDKLLVAFPGIEILIHPDPEGLVDEASMGAEDLLARGPNGESPALMAQGSPS
ncbi:cation diffusion facilitator family transporter [Novosphingobium sp. Chol11]|uniref:cation diffusion facilitator family transporter n=1 Tax=Novosphingobium sp. Chol11 TaxID=1385763 RepID=UPI0025E3E688|nr:cation diffusion facilitator family transporter [Novosphingobium sp. Chol11]